MKKYNYQDNFEMVYLRHEYARRCDQMNGNYVNEFAGVINTTARLMFDKLYPNFTKVGFDRDDIVNITSLYAIYYMELYSLRNNEEAREKYINKYLQKNGNHPTEASIQNYDRNSMINFLRQRIQHMSTLAARKARNITVGNDKRAAYAATENSIDVNENLIFENHKKYGYRKITQAELKDAKLKAKANKEQFLTDANGFKIIEIEMLNNGIGYKDYKLLFGNDENEYNKNPEELVSNIEQDNILESFREQFNNRKKSYKRKKLMDFIQENKDNRYMKEELTLARKLLSKKKIVV